MNETTNNNVENNQVEQNIPKQVGIGEFIGYKILFAIPVVGLIAMIVIMVNSEDNPNLKNFATATLIFRLVLDAILLMIIVLSGMLVVAIGALDSI